MWMLSTSAETGLGFCSFSQQRVTLGFHFAGREPSGLEGSLQISHLWALASVAIKRLSMRGQDRTLGLHQPSGLWMLSQLYFSGNSNSCWMSGGVLIIALSPLVLESLWFILVFLLKGRLCCPYLVPILFSTFFQYLLYLALQGGSYQAKAWLLNMLVMGLLPKLHMSGLHSLQDCGVSL